MVSVRESNEATVFDGIRTSRELIEAQLRQQWQRNNIHRHYKGEKKVRKQSGLLICFFVEPFCKIAENWKSVNLFRYNNI